MTNGRYPTAVEREKAKLAGIDDHPADKLSDPLSAQIADNTDAPQKKARLKNVGGSDHEAFNIGLANAVLDTAWFKTGEERSKQVGMISRELAAIAPRDELEGMIAAQMVAAHQASMECYRRAMIDGQTVEGRAMNLKHGTKASQTFAALLDALNRHRGRAPQKVIVEHRHVHFHSTDQAPTDRIEAGAARGQIENQGQCQAQALDYQPGVSASMWGEDSQREPVPRSGDDKRPVPNARRDKSGRSDG